jgi:hypothetical protein
MKADRSDTPPKVRLSGTVADVEACTLVTDQREIRVGSVLTCDLCVMDPLLPPQAFRIYQDSASTDDWLLESLSGTRLYLNNELTVLDHLHFGDQIHAGCHRFKFEPSPEGGRNYRSNAQVADVCRSLLTETDVPAGYLQTTPGHLNRRRHRQAMTLGVGLLLVLAALIVLTPREELFEQIQPPMEIVMVSPRALTPKPDSVKSLKNIQRRQVKEPTQSPLEPDFKPAAQPVPESMVSPEPKPLTAPVMGTVPRRENSPPKVELGSLAADPISLKPEPRNVVKRNLSALSRSAAAPRQNIPQGQEKGTKPLEIADKVVSLEPVTNLFKTVNAEVLEDSGEVTSAKPVAAAGTPANAAQVAALMKYQPSAVSFEKFAGSRIPIARLPSALNAVEMPGSDAAIVLDGEVSETEIAMTWKSGQFRKHAPGNPPPMGDPPTYCYVGKADLDNKPHLYISFICLDPDVGQIIAKWNGAWGNPPGVTWDDSVEIFLDINGDRNDYNQMIVNTRGQYWAAYYPTSKADGEPRIWNGVHPKIKTMINREAKRWTCEIFIPFAELGGVPGKGTRWTVNFCRNFRGQYSPNSNLQNWFLVYKNEQYFLKPNLFGVFEW